MTVVTTGYTNNRTVPPTNNIDPLGLSTCGDVSLGGFVDCGAKIANGAVDVAEEVGSFIVEHPEVIALGAAAILAAPIDLPLGVAATVEVVGQGAGVLGAGNAIHHAYDACIGHWTSGSCVAAATAAGIDIATLAAADRVANALARRGVEFLTPEQLKRLIAAQIEVGSGGVEALLDKICGRR